MKTLLIDCDEVLVNTVQIWIDHLNKISNTYRNWNDITDWDISLFYPSLKEKQLYEPLIQEDFWKEVKPLEGAVEYLQKLYLEDFDIYITTATDYRNIGYKIEYIFKKYFPFIPINHIIMVHNKDLIKGDIIIDDNINNLINNESEYKILFDAPHNKKYEAKGMNRVHNWKECYNLIITLIDYF